jgi:hypothetical protein
MHRDIASSSLRELDAVALTTNVTVFMKRGTRPGGMSPRIESIVSEEAL